MGNWVSDNINQSANTLNTESQDAAHASYCAGDENKYWEYHDMLFANWNGENQGAFSRKRQMPLLRHLRLTQPPSRLAWTATSTWTR